MITWGPWPGDQSGGSGPTSSFLSDIYDAGEASSPSVHNLMTGTLQQFFVNLGATPPPFPPDAIPFFPEAALFVGENPADSGVGADSKPLWRYRRWFSTFPSVGDQVWRETRYDLFAGGINQVSGGDRDVHWLVDQFENRLAFALDVTQLTRPGLNAPGYTPIYLDNAIVTYKETILADALGGGNTNDWQQNSDGSMFRRVLIPNAIGPGGGPAGPWNYVADAMSMWSRNGGEPLVGSRLYYDAVTVQTFGAVDDSFGQLIVAQAAVLDDKNLGSGQAAGHGETWIRSTLGGPLTLAASWYDDLVDIPVELITHNGAVFIGGATVDGTTATTGDVNVGADLHVGSGEITTSGDVTAGGNLETASLPAPALIQGVMESPLIDFLAAPASYALSPTFAGRNFVPIGVRFVIDQIDGTITTGPTGNLGNNGAQNNILANAIQMTAAACNLTNTAGAPALTTAIAPLVNQTQVDCATAFSYQVTAAAVANTATILKGRVFLFGCWIAP